MNKSDLIAAVASQAGITKADAEKAVNAFISAVTGSLKSGAKVTIPGFLTASKETRAARKGRNPSTGAEINIPAKNVVKIKAGKTLVEQVN